MKKLFSILLGLVLFLSLSSHSVLAAGCGAYEVYSADKSFCNRERCGLWDKTAVVQIRHLKKLCVRNDNTSYWHYGKERVHLACGC